MIPFLVLSVGGVAAAGDAIDELTRQALDEALADERDAQDTYAAVIARHGEVRPFVNIIEAERRHEQFLLELFARHGLEVPARTRKQVTAPAAVREACREAVAAEERNVAMYDRFLAQVEAQDVRAVFTRLQTASRDHHLPAFRRCVARGGGGRAPR